MDRGSPVEGEPIYDEINRRIRSRFPRLDLVALVGSLQPVDVAPTGTDTEGGPERMTKLWLDDERDPAEWLPHIRWMRGRPAEDFEGWVWARTADEAIEVIARGDVTIASLDHDLGDETIVGDGKQVLLWLDERTFLDETFPIPELHVHSSNTGARPLMELAIAALERRAAERAANRVGPSE